MYLMLRSTQLIATAAFLLIAGLHTGHAAKQGIPDHSITIAIEQSLSHDNAITYEQIDVSSKQGIVTLTGTVPSLYAKERAIRHAESLKGVRAVIDRIKVAPVHRTDAEVAKDVAKALRVDPATDSYEVKATVSDGIVSLTGIVQSYAEKDLAETVAKGVKGVKGITNDIRFQFKTDRADSEIQADIEQRLKNDVWLTKNPLTVEVKDGAVTLSGTVGSALEKTRASTRAYVLGAKSVDSEEVKVDWLMREQLRRTQYPNRTNNEIKRAVKDALLYDPRVWSFNPHVAVRYDTVTLTGVVDNLKAKTAAENDARNTVGVKTVKNYLKVRTKTQPPDETVATNVRSALLLDPLVDRYQITTTAYNGSASLYGTVDSYYEKWRAEDLASRAKGVLNVHNNLAVRNGWTWARDWEIKDDIEDELWWSPFVDQDQVRVSVHDGVATLRGSVDSWWEKLSATENAFEGGAKSVRNYLTVPTNW